MEKNTMQHVNVPSFQNTEDTHVTKKGGQTVPTKCEDDEDVGVASSENQDEYAAKSASAINNDTKSATSRKNLASNQRCELFDEELGLQGTSKVLPSASLSLEFIEGNNGSTAEDVNKAVFKVSEKKLNDLMKCNAEALKKISLKATLKIFSFKEKGQLSTKTCENSQEKITKELPLKELKTDVNNKVETNSEFQLDIDSVDPMAVYDKDYYTYLKQLEEKYPIKKHHLEIQKDVTGPIRAQLINWLVQVQVDLNLLPETLHLSVRIVDRYLQVLYVPKDLLKLIGITAMFVASKFEDVHPKLGIFVEQINYEYTYYDVIMCERDILAKLDFAILVPTPNTFIMRYIKAAKGNSECLHLASYLVDLSLLIYDMAHYLSSELAAAAVCLSLNLLTGKELLDIWNPVMRDNSGYELDQILPIIKNISKVALNAKLSTYRAIHDKYIKLQFNVSTLSQLEGETIRKLADI